MWVYLIFYLFILLIISVIGSEPLVLLIWRNSFFRVQMVLSFTFFCNDFEKCLAATATPWSTAYLATFAGAGVWVVHFPFHLAKGLGVKISEIGRNYYLWIIWDLANRGSGRPWEAAVLRLLFKPTLQHDCFEMICVTSGLKTYMSQCLYCFTISTHLSMNSWLLFFCTY